ncbi:hypothetical protein PRIPAC_93194 [Pristionchus pacificus]|uniref:PDZ domain-containing protein n=1 Tax=Pristionchus pacificus TaxID=54126 RepID=A0A2A6CCZ6_PRIPA|nr:hypothetical protein PRIPAC_93194 [Pristionchus pacificus]|eukprot:PDM76105.1 PDZ domain-containing protein [Pristionchus pacificus]
MPFKGLFKPIEYSSQEICIFMLHALLRLSQGINANLNGCGLWTEEEDDMQLEEERKLKEEKKKAKEEKKRSKEEEKEKKRQSKLLTDEELNNRFKAMGLWTEEEGDEDMAKYRLEKLEKKIMNLEKEKHEITTEWGEKWGYHAVEDDVKVMEQLKVDEKKPKKKVSLNVMTAAEAWGSHASGLASKDELKLEERKPKKKLSLSALTDEDEPKKPKKKFSLGSCVENIEEDEKWQRVFTSMGIGEVEDHKKYSEEIERNKLPEDCALSKSETIKFVIATFAIGLILFGLINVFFTSSSVSPTQFTFRNKSFEGYGLVLNWSSAKKEAHNSANFEVIAEADVAVLRTPGTDVSKEIIFNEPAIKVRLQHYIFAFLGYPLLGATLLAGLLYGLFCRTVEIRTVTLVETIENENFGLKINYGKISEVTPGGLADVSGDVETVPGGPADLAGFFKAGDFIVSINGLKIRHFEKPDGIYKFLNATRDHADLVVFNLVVNQGNDDSTVIVENGELLVSASKKAENKNSDARVIAKFLTGLYAFYFLVCLCMYYFPVTQTHYVHLKKTNGSYGLELEWDNVVREVPGGAANVSGLLFVNDCIVSINGISASEMERPHGITDFLERRYSVELEVRREVKIPLWLWIVFSLTLALFTLILYVLLCIGMLFILFIIFLCMKRRHIARTNASTASLTAAAVPSIKQTCQMKDVRPLTSYGSIGSVENGKSRTSTWSPEEKEHRSSDRAKVINTFLCVCILFSVIFSMGFTCSFRYLEPTEFNRDVLLTKYMGDCGMEVEFNRITHIEFGGAADASGEFRLNDYITSVNGVSTENFRLRYDLVNYMIITSNDEDTVKFGLKSINEVTLSDRILFALKFPLYALLAIGIICSAVGISFLFFFLCLRVYDHYRRV